MHRSGTSFAARSLALLGVSFGDESQLMGPGPDNATGYWENRLLKELDDELLSELGGSWDQPPVLEPGWDSPPLEPYRQRARCPCSTARSGPRRTARAGSLSRTRACRCSCRSGRRFYPSRPPW